MFMGSGHVKPGEFDDWLEGVGGTNNGSTENDRTNYWINVPSNAIELALFLESDRMGYLLDSMTPKTVDAQRDVVKNERRQSYENRPYGQAQLLLDELLYPEGHPYHWPVIGYMPDLTAASYDDVVDFFKKYYSPSNASLVVAGDIDPVATRKLVEKWFGDIKPGAAVETMTPPPVALNGVTKRTITDKVQLPRVYVAWLTPPHFAPGDAALDMVADALAGGKNSRLYKRLVYDLQIAQDVSAYQGSQALSSSFVIQATARPGHTTEELLKVIDEEVAKLQSETPPDRETQRSINTIEASFLKRLEQVGGFGGKADQLNAYFTATGQRRLLQPGSRALPIDVAVRRARRGGAVPAEGPPRRADRPAGRSEVVMRRLRALLNILTVVLTVVTLTLPVVVLTQAPDRSHPPQSGPPPALKLPTIQKRALSNGLPVWIVERHEVPIVQVNLVVLSGTGDDPAGKFGIASLTASMLTEGAGSRSALEIADAVDFLGADLVDQQRQRRIRGQVERAGRASRGCAQRDGRRRRAAHVSRGRARASQAQRLTSVIQARDNPEAIGQLGFARVLYGTTHRYGTALAGAAQIISGFTVNDVRAFYASAYKPANAALIVVGDVTPDRVVPLLETQFGKWNKGVAPAHATLTAPALPAARQVYIIDKPGAPQSQVRIGWVGVARSTPDYFPITVMNTVLGGAFSSRLNLNLREKHGYTYGASVAIRHAAGRGAVRRGRGCPDGQDRGRAEGVLHRARRHQAAGARRRTDARKALRVAALSTRLRNHRRHRGPPRAGARLSPAGGLLLDLRAADRKRHRRGRAAGRAEIHSARPLRRRHRRRSCGHRAGHPRP